MASHTRLFTEEWTPIARLNPGSQTVEQNTARFDMGLYDRIVVILSVGTISSNGTLDLDIEQHTAASGGSSKNVTGKSIVQLTAAGTDSNKIVAINLAAEELDIAGGYHFVSIEVTPATAAAIIGLLVLAGSATYEPVPTTNWDESLN